MYLRTFQKISREIWALGVTYIPRKEKSRATVPLKHPRSVQFLTLLRMTVCPVLYSTVTNLGVSLFIAYCMKIGA
jgi:hypothetical protein